MKIPGYTLHGDYYLSDTIIPNKNWEEACRMKQTVTLPNGKKVIAHTLSKEELETIPISERIGYLNNGKAGWYWTSTPYDDDGAWFVYYGGGFDYICFLDSNNYGGTRLGFHKNEIK